MKRITPTPRAQALNEEAERRIAATEAVLTRGLSREEIDSFLATAEKLKRNLIVTAARDGSARPAPAETTQGGMHYEEKTQPGQLYPGILAGDDPDAHLRHRRGGV